MELQSLALGIYFLISLTFFPDRVIRHIDWLTKYKSYSIFFLISDKPRSQYRGSSESLYKRKWKKFSFVKKHFLNLCSLFSRIWFFSLNFQKTHHMQWFKTPLYQNKCIFRFIYLIWKAEREGDRETDRSYNHWFTPEKLELGQAEAGKPWTESWCLRGWQRFTNVHQSAWD